MPSSRADGSDFPFEGSAPVRLLKTRPVKAGPRPSVGEALTGRASSAGTLEQEPRQPLLGALPLVDALSLCLRHGR